MNASFKVLTFFEVLVLHQQRKLLILLELQEIHQANRHDQGGQWERWTLQGEAPWALGAAVGARVADAVEVSATAMKERASVEPSHFTFNLVDVEVLRFLFPSRK
jgi:hypothetical protein